jgi:hypothetical protein
MHDHPEDLNTTRKLLVLRRRLAVQGLQKEVTVQRLDEFVALQAAIDSIDKAIDDEKGRGSLQLSATDREQHHSAEWPSDDSRH